MEVEYKTYLNILNVFLGTYFDKNYKLGAAEKP